MSMFSDAVINFFVNTKEAESALGGLDKKFNQTINSIQNGLIGKLGGITAGVLGIKSITNVYDETMKLVNLSERWNIPVEKVSQFSNAFAQFGGTADEAVGTIERFQQMANSLKFDSSGPMKELSAIMGTNLFNKDYMGAITALRSQYSKLNKDAQVRVTDMLGGDITLQRMLKASDEEFAAILEKSKKFGTISEKTANSMRKLDRSLATIKQAFFAISGATLERLVPVFDKLSGFMENAALASDDVKAGILGVLGAATLLGPALSVLKFALSGLFSWGTLGFGALAAGAYLLYRNWDKVSKAFNDYLEDSPRLKEFFKTLGIIIDGVVDGIKWLYDAIVKNKEVISSFFEGFGEGVEKFFGAIWDFGDWIGEKIAKVQIGNGDYEGKGAYAASQVSHIPPATSQVSYIPPAATVRAAQAYSTNQTTINNRNQQNQTSINRGTTNINVNLPNVQNGRQFVNELQSLNYNMTNSTL